jgi:hypothetical protein
MNVKSSPCKLPERDTEEARLKEDAAAAGLNRNGRRTGGNRCNVGA